MRSEALNKEFLTNDKAARNRVANAKVDAAKFSRGKDEEDLQIARKEAEADLIKRNALDNPVANLYGSLRSGFGLGTMLNGETGRDILIEEHMYRQAGVSRSTHTPKMAADLLAKRRAAAAAVNAPPAGRRSAPGSTAGRCRAGRGRGGQASGEPGEATTSGGPRTASRPQGPSAQLAGAGAGTAGGWQDRPPRRRSQASRYRRISRAPRASRSAGGRLPATARASPGGRQPTGQVKQ